MRGQNVPLCLWLWPSITPNCSWRIFIFGRVIAILSLKGNLISSSKYFLPNKMPIIQSIFKIWSKIFVLTFWSNPWTFNSNTGLCVMFIVTFYLCYFMCPITVLSFWIWNILKFKLKKMGVSSFKIGNSSMIYYSFWIFYTWQGFVEYVSTDNIVGYCIMF